MAQLVLVLFNFLHLQVGGDGLAGPYFIFRDPWWYRGYIDADGEFIPEAGAVWLHGRVMVGPTVDLESCIPPGAVTWEYRSGLLIQGRFWENRNGPCGIFVPKVGAFVVDASAMPEKGAGVVYNLPKHLGGGPGQRWQIMANRRVVPRWADKQDAAITTVLGRLSSHVFVQDLTPRVHHKWGDKVYVGNLDTYGRFIPDPLVPPQDPAKFAGIVPTSRPLMLGPDGRREVYEFRAGRLVPGKLTDDDRFVPQVGGLIIHIRDYVYTPEARPIYNLPGRFYPKGMKINVAGGEVPVEKIGNRWDLYPP